MSLLYRSKIKIVCLTRPACAPDGGVDWNVPYCFGVYQAISIPKMTQVVWASRGCLVLIASDCPLSFCGIRWGPKALTWANGRVEPPSQGGSLIYWWDASECHLPMRRICTTEKTRWAASDTTPMRKLWDLYLH